MRVTGFNSGVRPRPGDVVTQGDGLGERFERLALGKEERCL